MRTTTLLVAIGASSFFLAGVAVTACTTDNGQAVYGDQFAPNAKVDAANDGAPALGTDSDAAVLADASDAHADASVDGGSRCGSAALLAGSESSLSWALQKDGAPWVGASIVNGASKNQPALVAFGPGFYGAARGAGDALQVLSGTDAFNAVETHGQGALKAGPALTVVGQSAHLVYPAGSTYGFFHGAFNGAAYSPTGLDEAVGTPQAIGNSAAAIAAVGAGFAFVQAGTDNGLYFTMYSGGTWAAAAGISGAGAYAFAAPAMAATPGNTYDLVVVFIEKTSHQVQWTARNRTTQKFTTPINVDGISSSIDDLAVARTGAFTVLMTFRGTDGRGYEASGTENGTSFSWNAAVPIVAGGVAVDSAPAVATGVCGDDGILAYASGGQVRAKHLRDASWSTPELVAGVSGSRVAIATRLSP